LYPEENSLSFLGRMIKRIRLLFCVV